jgi:hypothetical protein
MRIRIGVVAVSLIALPGLVACGDDDQDKSRKDRPAARVGAPGAKVTIVSPGEGSSTGSTVTATVQLAGFRLDPAQVGKRPSQGVGHLHWLLDEGKYDFPRFSGPNGQLAERLGVAGRYSPSTAPTITYHNLPKGKHELEVHLANNDHSDTGVVGRTEFTVR